MTAKEFCYKINSLKEAFSYIDLTKENSIENIVFEGKNKKLNEEQIHKEFLLRDRLVGWVIEEKNSPIQKYTNEIENLVVNFNKYGMFKLLNDISINNEIELLGYQLYAFGSIDGYLCYDNTGVITWNDYDTLEVISLCASSSESFLDCMYTLSYNNLYNELDKLDLLENILMLSKTKKSETFFKYLIGID